MGTSDADSVRITLTLKEKVYDKVKQVSDQVGLRPSTWMTMVVTSKVNDVDHEIRIREEGEVQRQRTGDIQ